MEYNKFKAIFNETIFEKSKADLITKVAKYPQRYIGLFRPTKPKAKLLQNLLQSHEIRFGDADDTLYFVEQKVRDDHDSTKKRGQISNFEKKLDTIIQLYGDDKLNGYFYFIGPDLVKNRNFYTSQLLPA